MLSTRYICYERDNHSHQVTKDNTTHNFTLLNGDIKLNIITHHIENPTTVLIHIHGIGSHFQPLYDSMDCIKNRINVLDPSIISYAMELRGHGLSSGTRFSVNSFDDYISDLHILVEYIKKQHPLLPIFIIGHSMGGTIGIIYTIKYKDVIKGIILLAPMCGIHKEFELSWIKINTMLIISYIIPSYKLISISNDKQYKNYYEEFSKAKQNCKFQNNEGLRLDITRECYYAINYINENNNLFITPVLAIHSISDKITLSESTNAFVSLSNSSDKTIITPLLGEHNLLAPMFKNDPKPKELLITINQWISKII